MAGGILQQNRVAQLFTPLGPDVLVLSNVHVTEGLSEIFEISVEAAAEDENLDFDALIGRNCAVKVLSYGGLVRWFNGVAAEGRFTGIEDGLHTYSLVLRPWFWLLDHTVDCRFFQEKAVSDIIKEVFDEAGFTDYELKLSASYPKMEYCVQYRETHMTFVSRLMEEHGIYYFFKHSQDKHVMILTDGPGGHQPIEGGASRDFIPLTGAYRRDSEHIHTWTMERRFRNGASALNDYDFKKPGASLLANSQSPGGYAHSSLEIYDYPGRYIERSAGDTFARVRLQARQGEDQRRLGHGEAPSIYPGGKMSLKGHTRKSENIEYLVVRASHSVSAGGYRSNTGSDPDTRYVGSYVFQPSSRPFRAPILTSKPLIHGIQTAKVVGEEGEEITVDEHGRIKVQFHWDRKKKQSCWIRVAEMWSGKQWGSAFHPRHGQEVVVEFLEGDPDRPLVVGTVYNGDNRVPWALPAEKTKAGWKTDSSKGGGGFNEFRFEDKKSSEQVWLRAEKDLDSLVQNKETRKIGTNFDTPQGKSSRLTELVNGDDEHIVKVGDHKITVGHDQKIDVENEITITAGKKITIKCGGSTIVMDPTSITIKSTNIKIDASGQQSTHGGIVETKADGPMTIQGAVIKIN